MINKAKQYNYIKISKYQKSKNNYRNELRVIRIPILYIYIYVT